MFKFWKKNENNNENPDQEVNLEEGLSEEEFENLKKLVTRFIKRYEVIPNL